MSLLQRPLLSLAACLAFACASQPASTKQPAPPTVTKAPAPPPTVQTKLEERTEKYPNGQLQSKGQVRLHNGQEIQEGLWTHWYEDGSKAGEITYKDGKEHGPIQAWHPSGQVRASGFMKAGQPHGKFSTWYENGNREQTEHYKDGVPSGMVEAWYESGPIASRHSIDGDKVQGVDEGWYPDGKEMYRKSYKNGLPEGPALAWYENGAKRWEFTFAKGRLQGAYTRWYRDGKKWFEGSYTEGKANGAWKAYYPKGTRRLEATYSSGKPAKQRCWSEKGKKRKCADNESSALRGDYDSDSNLPTGERETFGEMYLMHLSKQKDRLCACDGDACVQAASGYMDKFAFEFQGLRPSPVAEVQLKSIGREISACRDALGSEYRGLYKQ